MARCDDGGRAAVAGLMRRATPLPLCRRPPGPLAFRRWIERNKGGAWGAAGVMAENGGTGTAVSDVWTAAAAARSWTAAAHSLAAWVSSRGAWTGMAEAAACARNAAEAGSEVVDKGCRLNTVALGNGAAALESALRAQRRAVDAFREAAAHAGMSASEWEQAAAAHAMARDEPREQMARRRAGQARAVEQVATRWAARAGVEAETIQRASHVWRECADRWAGGAVWPEDRTSWVDEQARIHADAEYTRAKWAGKVERAEAAVQDAAGTVQRYAAMAERYAAMVGRPNGLPAGSKDAARAWGEAMQAARAVVVSCQPGDRPAESSRKHAGA